jgi:alpha-beta hydrolase superfamily lysophospholipase
MIEKTRRAMKTVNGLNIFYRECGMSGQPMLCLHGKYGRGETWYDLMSRYGSRFRVIAPDQRGHGLSDKPIARYAGEDFAADRGGFGNSDSVVSGSLASPKPPGGGEPEERGNEKNTTESRGDV